MADKTTDHTLDMLEFFADKQMGVVSDADSQLDTVHDGVNRSCRTHDFYQLINVFISEVRRVLPCDGVKYREDRLGLNFIDGVISQYQCNYEIKYGEQLLGTICFSRDREFMESELAKIEELVAGLVQPLRSALHYQQAVRFALRDDLTGLRNGSSYYDSITLEIARSRRYKVPFSLLMINLDNFRDINEQYGHAAGNTLLVEVARRLEHESRSSDIIFRKGGDEFLVFLPSTASRTALKVAERIKKSVLSGSCIVENNDVRFTMSIGVVTVLPDDSAFKLIGRADKALFHAKILGKDRIQTETGAESLLQEWT
jgi:diguanylate cyclase (GGDEF)-like protein